MKTCIVSTVLSGMQCTTLTGTTRAFSVVYMHSIIQCLSNCLHTSSELTTTGYASSRADILASDGAMLLIFNGPRV
jgi:hypothetical protein